MSTLRADISQWLQLAAQHHIRLPVVWQGDAQSLLNQSRQLLTELPYNRLYWIGADAPADALVLDGKQNFQLLGSECDLLVINAFSGFPADLIAASAGCVKAGGLWLLLCPPLSLWAGHANPAHKSLLPYPLDANTHKGCFLPFWLNQLQQQNMCILQDDKLIKSLHWPLPVQPHQADLPCVTQDQQAAVVAIMQVVHGHRRRPLVLSADRGRGKSAALGIAAAKLAPENKHIIITAPTPQAAATALHHFQQLAAAERHQQLQFIPFDRLLRGTHKADLLLVDEAAAIPTPVLQQLLHTFSRVVFATTEHGYEGTGRGFQLRFQQYLTQHCPGWKKLHLSQPIRYQANDPLEQTVFRCFLLQYQFAGHRHYQADCALTVCRYQNRDWLVNPDKLQQIFHLLSLAHYQTQVKDLVSLLDNPYLQVVSLEHANQVLACALVSVEGDIPKPLTEQIYHGKRRLQGHLLAQSLAFHLAKPHMASLPQWRIMRIAVLPQLQRQGIGSKLLQEIHAIAQSQQVAYLGSSFGVSQALLHFWQEAGYMPVRLGHSTDKASNEYSLLVLKPVTADPTVVSQLQQDFAQQLYHCITQYPLLEAGLACQLAQPPHTGLNNAQQEQLRLFSQGTRPFELAWPVLLYWFNQHCKVLAPDDCELLYLLLWQRQPASQVQHCYQLNGKKGLVSALMELVNRYINLSH